ncbi:MAG: hypothetical protein EXS37_09020 [Opitutus sp.]|nr:hypothetical protein [Opitutus sp.]
MKEERPWAEWVERDFPFFSSVVDAREAGPGFPRDNLTPRGIVLNLGHDMWACFDADLLRISAVWSGEPVTLVGLVPISYHVPGQTNFIPKIVLPRPNGRVWLANGIYPGWQVGTKPSLTDPRTPAPSLEEIGRGPLTPEESQFRGLRLVGNQVLLDYTVAGTAVCERISSSLVDGRVHVKRHFRIQPTPRPLLLLLGQKPVDASTRPDPSFSLANLGSQMAAETVDDNRVWALRVAPHAAAVEFVVAMAPGPLAVEADIQPMPGSTTETPLRWPQTVTTQAKLASANTAYVVDNIPLPLDNPWRRNPRLADIQFFRDGSAAAVTLDGDVWRIDGLSGDLQNVRWRRFASGFHEPLSLTIRDDQIFVFDRTGIWRLRDTRGTGEADQYEMFCNNFAQTAAVREHPCSMKLAPDGSFVIAKGGSQDATLGKDNGKVLRVSADGRTVTILGTGFRMPFVGVNPRSGLVAASDQQGFYVPTTPVYLLGKNEYHGYLDDFLPPEKYPAPIADPLTWIPHPVNPAAISLTWLAEAKMGPLNDSLVLVGYNRPEIFRIMTDDRHAKPQAAVVSITADFRFAPLNAAVNPGDGQLYVTGVLIYGSSGEQVSGLARVRYTGVPSVLPNEVVAMDKGFLLRFDVALETTAARLLDNYIVGRWNYKRTHHYGSANYKLDGTFGQDRMALSGAYLSTDGKSVFLAVPDMKAGVDQMHVGWAIATKTGVKFSADAYLTPYSLAAFVPTSEGFGALAIDMQPKAIAPPVSNPIGAEEGLRLAGLLGCVGCHTTNGTVGTARLAPSWKGLFGRTVTLNDGSTVIAEERYIHDHILKRTDKFVKGFENAMPNYSGIVTEPQIESLILYIKTLR